MHRSSLSARALLVLSSLLWGACSLIVDNPMLGVTNHCVSDADCSGGGRCDSTMSMCVQEPTLPYDLWLEIAPANDPTAAPVLPIDLGPYTSFSGSVSLVMPRQVSVRGTVTRDRVPVAAQVTFIPSGTTTNPIAVRSVSTRTTTSGDYTMSVPSHATYDVLVEPTGDSLATVPPFRYPSVTVGTMDMALQIGLPTDPPQLAGTLVASGGNTPDGFEVLAIDRASGATVSSVATTMADGAFTIWLAATTTPFDLVVRPSAMRQSTGLAPTYRVHPENLLPDTDNHVHVLLPATVDALVWSGTVEWPDSRGSRPVQGAVVQLHSDDILDATTGVVGSIDLALTTDANGIYSTMVLPGHYTVTITAATDEELGVLSETRDLRTALIGHIFELPLRTVLSGTVQSPDGDLVRDAHVRATPTGAALAGITNPDVARLARPATALSGAMGDFRLELDVGVYDVVAEPPDGSGFAWTVDLGYGVGGSTATLADVMQVDAPVVVESDLTWLDGGTLAGAEVRAFAITSDHRAVMVGRTTSDTHGHARLLVPASLGSHDPAMALRRP